MNERHRCIMGTMIIYGALQTALTEGCRLQAGTPILLGFSGGPDSLCLLHGLRYLGWPVTAAHFDHGMRPESAKEVEQVAGLAAALGVPLLVGHGDVPAFARANSLSLEEAARTLRYRFLFEQARRCGAQVVAVAHTADDQVETILMHFLRGAGLAGLKGMPMRAVLPEWDAELPLIRPLLGIWREEVEGCCAESGLHPLRDPSNQDTTFFRNRLRHELIPYLEQYNPNLRSVLWRSAQALAGDYETLEPWIQAVWADCVEKMGPGFIALKVAPLVSLGEGMQRSLLRRAVSVLRPGLRDIGFDALRRAQEFLTHPSRSGEMDLLDGLLLLIEKDTLFIYEDQTRLPYPWPKMGPVDPVKLELPGLLELPGGAVITARWGSSEELGKSPWQAALDYATLTMPLYVRRARPGERWQPLGMDSGTIKFSDFWINAGLPRRARAGWPLVCAGEAVAWLPGFRPANFCRVTEKTQRVVILEMKPPAGQEFQLD